jgi:hypothetical protein
MPEQFEGSEQEDIKFKVKPLILRIYKEKSLDFLRISKEIRFSYASLIKWKNGKSFPRDNKVQIVVERLEKLWEDLEFQKSVTVLQPKVEKRGEDLEFEKTGTVISSKQMRDLASGNKEMKSRLVIIYFDPAMKTESYTGEKIGAIVKVNGKEGIIAYENDSIQYGDADGLIYLDDASLDPYAKSGSVIAIKKINKTEWDPGYYYYIIAPTGKRYLRKLFEEKGEDKEDQKVRLVSNDENRFPAIILPLNKIKAIFQVERITFKPE